MDWYAAKDGGQIGPLADAELAALFSSGEISAETLVWREGMPDWQRLDSLRPELFGGAATQPNPPADEPMAVCAVSGAARPQSQMLQYGDQWVAPENKERFLQGLREGAPLATVDLTANGYVFRDPKLRANLARIAFITLTISSGLFTLVEFALPESPIDEFTAVDGALGLLGLVMAVGMICSIVFFSMWTHRVAANAYALGGERMEISPGWAVGWYFIPFANLVKPYQALKQVWQTTFQVESISSLMPTWWALWLISNLLGNISFRLTMRGMAEASLVVDIITSVLDIGLLIVILAVIKQITGMQISRAAE